MGITTAVAQGLGRGGGGEMDFINTYNF